ncbi:MAG: hypothetical protein CL565_05800 [Alphaproteobacteria bacterium]|nr:hypothetical protein [Alphaproteobacteria bacterium]|tara:strand:- start:583 stop:1866 length:1284 start_codon:yes stop_codon:yes gene_type:complete
MSGPRDNNQEIQISPNPGCKVSYTLNNYQPVRCSFIGDEPLFFLDTEDTTEEAGLFDASFMDDLSFEIDAMEHKLNAYDKVSQQFRVTDTHVADLFSSSCDEIFGENESASPDIASFLKRCAQSRYLKTLLDFAAKNGVAIEWSSLADTADYDRNANKVLVNPNLEEALQILSVARELRRVWQHKNGVLIDPTAFYPDQGILINRIQEADLAVSMVRTAWEMQLSGDKDTWICVENSSLSDLGRAFAREACNDFRSINNGQAALGVIEAWFLSERCRRMDRKYIQRMLAGPTGKSFDQSESISRQAATNLIYALGETPYGKNYLASHVQYILDDPIFCEIRDRANANFLWFIKFENSYSEAEQSLQKKEAVTQGSQNDKTASGEKSYTQKNETEIIAFPRAESGSREPSRKAASGGAKDGGTILPFG